MPFVDYQFDPHLPSFMYHTEVLKYLKDYADHFNLMPLIHLNTVITNIASNGTTHTPPPVGDVQFPLESCVQPRTGFTFHQWKVTTQNVLTKTTTTEIYDAVVVCSGHFCTPWKSDVVGLENFPPSKVIHSHSYRDPDTYQGQTVLVVGSKMSAIDISLDLSSKVKLVVMSSRKKPLTCPLPENVKQFVEVEQVQQDGVVLFKDGKTLLPDSIILCNGYDFSFPFLDEMCGLTLDSRRLHPLHKHVFNAVHPSMAFVGFNFIILPFPYFDLQSCWLLSVWSGVVKLPSAEEMIAACDAEFARQQAEGVPIKYTHFLAGDQWEHYCNMARNSGSTPPYESILKLYSTLLEHRIIDIVGFKNYQFSITGRSSFLVLSESATPKGDNAKPKIKIAIIGAGISGLCAVRHSCKFLDRVSVTVFEEGALIKSWWDYPTVNGGKPPGEYLRTNLPAELTGFQDFAFQPNTDAFPTPAQVLKYLQDYCEHYELLQHVKFNHRVDHVSLKEGSKWSVKVTDLINNQTLCEEFDNVFVCSDLPEQSITQVEDFKLGKNHVQHKCDLFPIAFAYFDGSCGLIVDGKCGIQPLCFHTFNTRHPSMAFLGAFTNISFAYCDMQVMWALRVWLGLQQPPQQSIPDTHYIHLDFARIYNDLANYSEMPPASEAFIAVTEYIFKSRNSDQVCQPKNEKYNFISSQHWILTNNYK
ncbi:flavin-containing monooxygenase 3-like isoform X2 [Dysidea avara]